ncbi:lytic transglycosylase [Ralstonia pickettii]|uniref:Lytic transglycosylase n=1 Tax=Ralstonia pickettii TaxID=329 RepID=A0A7X2HS95_RALPI|nr:lytic transglycosylase [Ralstonia pickettii]
MLPMKSFARFFYALLLAAVLPASAFAAPTAYNFGWTTAGAEMVKPFQVFDDGQYIYVQFDDPAHVPAILTETPNGTALLSWRRSYPYIVISYPANVLIFRTGNQEARATRWYVDGVPQVVLRGTAAPVKTTGAAASQGNE